MVLLIRSLFCLLRLPYALQTQLCTLLLLITWIFTCLKALRHSNKRLDSKLEMQQIRNAISSFDPLMFFSFSVRLFHTGKLMPSKGRCEFTALTYFMSLALWVLCCCPKAAGVVLAFSSVPHCCCCWHQTGCSYMGKSGFHEPSAPKSVPV